MTYEQELRITQSAVNDPIYQDILAQCRLLEPEYLRIRDSLPESDRLLLERYISLCEELDHRKLCIALSSI